MSSTRAGSISIPRERRSPLAGRLPLLVFSACLLLLTPSCYVNTHRIGTGPTGLGEESARQYYILFGLLQLNDVNVQRMAGDLTGYEITTKRSFTDYLLFPVLGWFTITSRTVTVRR